MISHIHRTHKSTRLLSKEHSQALSLNRRRCLYQLGILKHKTITDSRLVDSQAQKRVN